MKHIITAVMLLLLCVTKSSAQTKDNITFYDINQDPCSEKNATFLSEIEKMGDSLWQMHYYYYRGPRILTESYKDEARSIPDGRFIYYNLHGERDSIQLYTNGELDSCIFLNPGGKWTSRTIYLNGNIIRTDTAWRKPIDSTKTNKDIAITPGEKDSEFSGGRSAWAKYLNKNIEYPDKAVKYLLKGTVVVQFLIDKNGEAYDFEIFRSANYWMDKEALRVLKKSGKWTPAEKDGVPVKSYKLQPITFRY